MARRLALVSVGSLSAALAVVTYLVSFHTARGNRADLSLLQRIAEYPGTPLSDLATVTALLCNAIPYALLAGTVLLVAYTQRGPRVGLVLTAVIVVPSVITRVLKQTLADDRTPGPVDTLAHVDPASWPSGHATAALVLAFCVFSLAPPGRRAIVAFAGAAFAFAVGVSVVILAWHLPSDTVGGWLVGTAGACFGAALLPAPEPALVSPPAATAALASRSPSARG